MMCHAMHFSRSTYIQIIRIVAIGEVDKIF